MVSVEEIQAQVDADWATLSMPTWPNPRAGDREPREEEYSRVTDAERFAVVHARARTWASVLSRVRGVTSELWQPESGDECWVRGVRVTSALPGVLPLLLLEGDDPHPRLRIAAAHPSWGLTELPDCACDACDHGSAMLLEALDETISRFVEGPCVLMRGHGWTSRWWPEGGRAGGNPGAPSFEDLMQASQLLASGEQVVLPSGTDVVVSQSWLA